jgi:hypothetical protein
LTGAWLAFPLFAQASPITYVYDGFGTGTLGGSPFTDAAFTITASADTDNITVWSHASGGPQYTHLSTLIDIAGLGSFSITAPSHSWISGSDNGWGGLGENLSSNWITLEEPALFGYGLDTLFGPVLENSPLHVDQFNDVATTGGTLGFSSISSVTFAAIPEPATLSLLALGTLAAIRRRGGTVGYPLHADS